MINLNIYWQLFETVFKQRKSWYVPEPIYRKKLSDKDIIRKFHIPGVIIPYQSGGSPYSTLLSQIEQKENDLEFISKNVMKGIHYGVNEEILAKAEKAFEEMQEGNDTALQGQTRLQSLYPILQRTPEVNEWRHWKIIRTPYRVDSNDEKT